MSTDVLEIMVGDEVAYLGGGRECRSPVRARDDRGLLVMETQPDGALLQVRIPWDRTGLRRVEAGEEPAALPVPATEAETALAGLTDEEAQRLAELETVITHGLRSFRETGRALLAVRDERLYRASHASFETYLRERWEISRPRGYELMAAAAAAENLSAIADTVDGVLPANEAQLRPLTRLETPEAQQAAWQTVVESTPPGEITAARVEEVVREQTGARDPYLGFKVGEFARWFHRPDAPWYGQVEKLSRGELHVRLLAVSGVTELDPVAGAQIRLVPSTETLERCSEEEAREAVRAAADARVAAREAEEAEAEFRLTPTPPSAPDPEAPPLMEQVAKERGPSPPASKPGALKTAQEKVAERAAARADAPPAGPAPLSFIVPGLLRQRFEDLGGYPVPAITLWCKLAELCQEHEIAPKTGVDLLSRFLGYCEQSVQLPDAALDTLETEAAGRDVETEAENG